MNATGPGLSGLELVFLICAVIGGALFVLRFILQLAGVHDTHMTTDISAGHADVTHADADVSFRLLTLQGLTAFFMMFGLVGFALLRENRTGNGVALAGAVAAGLGTVWIIGKIFSAVKKLQSSGTIDNAAAIGEQGSVYLTIHPKGTGKVQITMKGRIREFDAVSQSGGEIRTGERIKVTAVNGSTVVVEKL